MRSTDTAVDLAALSALLGRPCATVEEAAAEIARLRAGCDWLEGEARLLRTITHEMGAADDPTAALRVILREVCEVTGWALGQAWLPDGDGKALRCSPAWYGRAGLESFRAANEDLSFTRGEGLLGRVWAARQPLWSRDVTLETDFARQAVARAVGLKAALAIPVLDGGDMIAVLEFFVAEPREEDARLVDLVAAATAQLGAVVRRKQAAATLERQAAALRAQAELLDLANDAIMVRDPASGVIVFWNDGAREIYGWSAAEAVGQVSDTLLRTAFPEPRVEIEAQLRETGRWEGELAHSRRDGARIVVASRWALRRDEQGAPAAILEINSDVTARKWMEVERAAVLTAEKEYSRRLEDLNRLKADFTAMVAHELSSPIGAIQGWTAVLATGEATPEQQRGALVAIETAAVSLATLVADVQSIATLERDDFAVQARPVALADLLSAAEAFARTLHGDHAVTIVPPADADLRVHADRERVGQVLRNLLSNAAKYAPDGAPIEVRARREGARMRVEVADRGYGIHPDDHARIFEKFGRGRDSEGRAIPGVGLGLYLSRRIVRAHGSDLTVSSEPGEGSVFGFDLEVAR